MSPQNEGFHEDVEWLVSMALKKLPQPYGADVIEDVYVAIGQHSNLALNYQQLCVNHDQATVNQRVGHFIRELTGYKVGKSVATTRTDLAKTYTVLIPPKG